MKNLHDTQNYTPVDTPPPAEQSKKHKGKRKLSGAYYYVDKDEKKLATLGLIRSALTVLAFILQVIVLIMPPQDGAMYVSKYITSYAFIYVLIIVFGLFFTSIWLMIMNQVRYKFTKRIPVEYCPKHGFNRRAFFGNELYVGVHAVLLAIQISFVCISYDGVGLAALFICAAALAAAIAARELTRRTFKCATLVPAPSESEDVRSENN